MNHPIERRLWNLFIPVCCLFLLCSLLNGTAFAVNDPIPEVSQWSIQFYVDYAAFKNFEDKHQTYVEVYLSILGDQLTYVREEAAFCAVAEISVVLRDVKIQTCDEPQEPLSCSEESIMEMIQEISSDQESGQEDPGGVIGYISICPLPLLPYFYCFI